MIETNSDTIDSGLVYHYSPASPPVEINAGQARHAIEISLRLGDSVLAEQAARTMLEFFPGAIIPLILLGRALLDQGAYAAAIAQFRAALARNSLDATAWAGLAGALGLSGQHGAARTALERAALHDPLESEMLTPGVAAPPPNGLGILYLRRGYAALAVAELAAALERQPQRNDLRIYYIEALRRNGDLPAARRQLDLIAPADPPSLPMLLLCAAIEPPPSDTDTIRRQCAIYDLDGHMTRRFFAPERPPWELAPIQTLPWSATFEPLARHLARVPSAHKSMPTHSGQPARQQHEQGRQHEVDSDVSAFVTTTERLRHRLAASGARPLPLNGAPATQLVLGCKSTLLRRYGESGFAAIDRRLRLLAEALRRRGVQTYCCYIDDADSLQIDERIALAPVARQATAIRDLVRAWASGLGQQEPGPLLLIGGDDSIPFHRLPNLLYDDDKVVLSDNPYGSDDSSAILPQRIIARLPDGDTQTPTLLLALLDQMLDYHHKREPLPSHGSPHATLLGFQHRLALRTMPARDAGYSAEIWKLSSRAILDAIDADASLLSSPPIDAETLGSAGWVDRRLLFVNLHGATGLANWYGQAASSSSEASTHLPIALRPDHFTGRRLAGGLLISEACYGVELAERTADTSIPLQALAHGALGCIGATASAYGSASAPLVGADLLCQRLVAHLAAGAPVGEALHQARLEFAQTMYRRQGYLDDVDIKTLTEFVLLGDPWATIASPSTAASWPVTKLAGIERVPKPRPKAVLDEAEVPRDLLQRARAALRRVLPGARAAPLHIIAQPSPHLASTSRDEQELIFSAQQRQLTADGHQIAQTVHITLTSRTVSKVALTH